MILDMTTWFEADAAIRAGADGLRLAIDADGGGVWSWHIPSDTIRMPLGAAKAAEWSMPGDSPDA
jgi:hypothetical protein